MLLFYNFESNPQLEEVNPAKSCSFQAFFTTDFKYSSTLFGSEKQCFGIPNVMGIPEPLTLQLLN